MEARWYQQEVIPAIFDYFQSKMLEPDKQHNPVIAWPTGIGKSYVPAMFIVQAFGFYPNTRCMMLTHVKELIEQNASKLRELWPGAPLGIYSAGLGQKDTAQPIIFGGIASVCKCPELFGHRDIIFVDECHLLSLDEDSMYQEFITALRKINPYLRVIGLSATPFRMGQGLITDGGLFTDIIHDLTTYDNFNRLIREGFLCPPIPRPTKTQLDLSSVGTSKGEFILNQLQGAVDKEETTYKALAETCEYGHDRHAWLIFASGVDHAEHIASQLAHFGVSCEAVHSKMKAAERDRRIAAFKAGELRALANNNVLTTGFDHPPIDLIVMLRPTMSPGLWVQMVGRGTRPSPETQKRNCLVLDFARNTERLGPINDPKVPRKKGEKPGDVPIKICDFCGVYNHARATHCISCGELFTFKEKIVKTASTHELLRGNAAVDVPTPEFHTFNVVQVTYSFHQKTPQAKPVVKVQYQCGVSGMFSEWICPEHPNPVGHKARIWWRRRSASEPPTTVVEALRRLSELKVPRRVRVHVNKKPYPEVVDVEF